MSSTKEKFIGVIQGNQSKIVNGILVLGGIYITYRLGKKLIAEFNKSNAQDNADDSPEVRQAMTLKSAMNPSGISWMMSFDTTNSSQILNTAKSENFGFSELHICSSGNEPINQVYSIPVHAQKHPYGLPGNT